MFLSAFIESAAALVFVFFTITVALAARDAIPRHRILTSVPAASGAFFCVMIPSIPPVGALTVLQARPPPQSETARLVKRDRQLKPGFFADLIAVLENPLTDITATQKVTFVMKGEPYRR